MAVPKTFHQGNLEDRAYSRDLWSWLEHQPQDAWLLWARRANWDNARLIFERMLDRSDCDRAIVSWLFWMSGPAFWINNPSAYRRPSLTRQILRNLQRGYYRKAELAYDRYEVVHEVHAYLAALKNGTNPPPFALPRELCGPFDGRPARLPETYDEQTERELAELFTHLDGCLPRSDRQHQEEQARSGNSWIKATLRLPRPPRHPDVGSDLADEQYLEAIFGTHEAYLQARRKHASARERPSSGSFLTGADMTILKLLAGAAILAPAGTLIAHWLRTGSW